MKDQYGHWTVIERVPPKGTNVQILCRCKCGKKQIVPLSNLASGRSTQCRECRWQEQTLPRKPKDKSVSKARRFLTFQGKTQELREWAKELNISRGGLYRRLRYMSLEEALTGVKHVPK